jgi:hypothetical protein
MLLLRADGSAEEFDAGFVASQPLEVGTEFETPGMIYAVAKSVRRSDGRYIICLDGVRMHATDIHGRRL